MPSPIQIMLLGSGGQIGQAVQKADLPEGWALLSYNHQQLDLTNHQAVRFIIDQQQPDFIINCSAMASVDACQQNEAAAVAINFHAVANLAAICSVLDIPLLHLSTDYVFDGRQAEPYQTDDQLNPINIYGSTKLMGEEAIRHELAWHVILRVSAVFSPYANNMLTKALHGMDTQSEMRISTDQSICPTFAGDIADAIITIAKVIISGSASGYGTFHLCGDTKLTRFEFIKTIMEHYAPFAARLPPLLPALSTDFPLLAPRPVCTALDCAKIKRVYGISQQNWIDGLKFSLQQIGQQREAQKA